MNFRSRMASLQYSRRSDQQHGGDHSARGAGPRPTITGSGLSIAIIRHAPADRRLLAIIPFVFILKRHAATRRQPVGALRVATKQTRTSGAGSRRWLRSWRLSNSPAHRSYGSGLIVAPFGRGELLSRRGARAGLPRQIEHKG